MEVVFRCSNNYLTRGLRCLVTIAKGAVGRAEDRGGPTFGAAAVGITPLAV